MRFGKDNGKETSREYLKECEVLVLSGKYMDSHKYVILKGICWPLNEWGICFWH